MDKLELTLTRAGLVGVVNGKEELADLAAFQSRAPDAPAETLAQVASALGKPGYDAILDPAAYETLTRERIDNENANMPWQPGVMRIRDFGMPDFDAIQPPRRDGNTLTYHARDTHTGLPYQVVLPLGAPGDADISPLPLTPFEGDQIPVPKEITENAPGPRKGSDPVPVEVELDDDDEDADDL